MTPRPPNSETIDPAISWRARGLGFATGAMGVLGLAPFHLWPATVAMFAVLFVRLRGVARAREGFSVGLWTGLGYFSCGMFWIAQAFFERGAEYVPLIVPLVLGLFVLLSLFWGAAGALFAGMRSSGGVRAGWDAVALAALIWLAEFARGHLFGGFPWNLPGYAWEAGTAMSQLASVVGVWGLSALVILSGTFSGLAVVEWRRAQGGRSLAAGTVALGIVAGSFAFGAARLAQAPSVALTEAPSVADARPLLRLVHVPFRQNEMMDENRAVLMTNRYFRETLRTPLDTPRGRVTHIVWPEGAVRGEAVDDLGFLSVFARTLEGETLAGEALAGETLAGETDPPHFLFTSQRSTLGPNADGVPEWTYFNSAVAVSYEGGAPAVAGWTDKYRLVPFGEVVPFPADAVLELFGLGALAASFTPADGKGVSTLPDLPPASVQICYEVVFPALTRPAPGDPDARWILNQSNDAWFGSLSGPAQHAATARMRALEDGLPLVRAAANGWSGTVDAWGRWVARMGPDATGHLDVALPAATASTIYQRWMDAILVLIMLSGILCAFVAGRNSTA